MDEEKVHHYKTIEPVLQTEVYSGPIELLLELVNRNELNPLSIPVSIILDEFLLFIENRQKRDIKAGIDFLLITALLLHIKLSYFLPSPDKEEEKEIEIPLSFIIQEYEKLKKGIEYLGERMEKRAKVFQRGEVGAIDEEYPDAGVLFKVFYEIFTSAKESRDISIDIPKIEDKIKLIRYFLKENQEISFKSILKKEKYRIGMIVLFLAVLELVKSKEITFIQRGLFGDIILTRRKNVR